MKATTIYAVIQRYYDYGKAYASMIAVPADNYKTIPPKQVYEEKRDHDLYIDYFTDKAEAEAFLQDCYRA